MKRTTIFVQVTGTSSRSVNLFHLDFTVFVDPVCGVLGGATEIVGSDPGIDAEPLAGEGIVGTIDDEPRVLDAIDEQPVTC
jgi:hypothetical protein